MCGVPNVLESIRYMQRKKKKVNNGNKNQVQLCKSSRETIVISKTKCPLLQTRTLLDSSAKSERDRDRLRGQGYNSIDIFVSQSHVYRGRQRNASQEIEGN